MLIAGVLCVCAAIVCAALGLWSLSRPSADTAAQVTRAVAPTQLAAAVMLAAGGAVAFAGPRPAAGVLVGVCVVGAIGTVAVGSWQSARYALRREGAPAVCGGDCGACTLSCH
ncbi:hypothetical protein MFM001_04240 [Mycobacterium sp. MFM001]|uniref:hypothetical protein n=1 Tax=Mycobacterium sp. MFM001 TaxID=2049453 RepID=UPI000DA526DD|nr:hypothetical protein [Mycobacterium sp. MFM001]GBE63962.1 hypothetical protein MFM001_04240 [Mycobacterium sp. MFM001]